MELLYATGFRKGRVVSVGALLDPTTKLVTVLIDPSKNGPADGGLLPGAPVRASVQIGEMTGWLAPTEAVLTDPKGPYVFQVDAGKALRVDAQIIGMAGDTTVIAGPLDPSRKLVAGGNYQLHDGVAVPKRWIVERTIAWFHRCRRLAKDWECLSQNGLALLRWASIRLMLRKLCQAEV